MGRRGGLARRISLKREKQRLETERRSEKPDDDEARRIRVQKQIDSLLTDMEETSSLALRLKIGAALERLWKLVQPTAGVLKQSRRPGAGASRPMIEPVAAPQASEPDTTS